MNRSDREKQVDRGKVWPDGFSVKPFSLLPIYLYGAVFTANEVIQLLGGQPAAASLKHCIPLFLLAWALILLGPWIWFLFHFRSDRISASMASWKRVALPALALALLVLHIRSLAFERVQVHGESMEPTLENGESFWIRKTGVLDLSVPLSWRPQIVKPELRRGQIVIYRYPTPEKCHSPLWIKRLVALPGDSYELRNGEIRINGAAESYPPWVDAKAPGSGHSGNSSSSAFRPPPTYAQPEGYQPPLAQVNPAVRALGVEAIYAAMNGLPSSGTVPPGSILVLGDNRSYSRDSRIVGFIPLSYVVGFAGTGLSD